MIDPTPFEEPWEHLRLLSDAPRNRALLTVLERHAPGARVLEVGCGTGLLSCLAARMGAERVLAVEPTALADVARELVAANDLGDRVEVIDGRIEALEPRPVDLAFSELLNADPFVEGLMSAMSAAARWTGERGRLCPRRIRVHVALVHEAESAAEVRRARDEVARVGKRYGLQTGPLQALFASPGPYTYVHHVRTLASEPACVWDLAPGRDAEPDVPREVRLHVREPGPVGGAVVWFEAELDEGVVLGNAPGQGGHWGQLVSGWPTEVAVVAGQEVAVEVVPDDGVVVRPVGG